MCPISLKHNNYRKKEDLVKKLNGERKDIDEILGNNFQEIINRNLDIVDVHIDRNKIIIEFYNEDSKKPMGASSLLIHNYVTTLGIDIVGYSKGNVYEKVVSSAKLFAFINQTIDWFRRKRPDLSQGPEVIIPTGDGAFLVFKMHAKSVMEAIQFSLILNLRLHIHNTDVPPVGGRVNIVRIPLRFTLACGDAVFISDVNNNKNVLGDSVINCSRILSLDTEAHFLIDEQSASCLTSLGELKEGIDMSVNGLFGDFRDTISGPYRREIKSCTFEFYNLEFNYTVNSLRDDLYDSRQLWQERVEINIGNKWHEI